MNRISRSFALARRAPSAATPARSHRQTRQLSVSMALRNRDEDSRDPAAAATKDKSLEENTESDGLSSLDDIFKMLDLPDFDSSTSISSKLNTNSDTSKDGIDGNSSKGIDDLFMAMDKNKSMHGTKADSKPSDSDPMSEFERILADLADNDTEVFNRGHRAPLFWDSESRKNPKYNRPSKDDDGEDDFLKELTPESLFKKGPRASAFSAGKLESDPQNISSMAARIMESTKLAKNKSDHQQSQQQPLKRAKISMKRDPPGFKEMEQNQLGKLSMCRSVTALSTFVYEDLLSHKRPTRGESAPPRPSPLVYADAIRVARELREPQIALFIYNFCHTHMNLTDRLRILDSPVYEELLATTWNSMRDISAVMRILQDAIAMGVVANSQLERQIDQIIIELQKLYHMQDIANQLIALKRKIMPKSLKDGSTDAQLQRFSY
ncbi:hypothetical protein LPJ53_002469 [Coemansia erecta]|uniref:Mtf2-like C-terminal domain-containing protein n=1 Tax=Coemansia erecta TaxID=147472 RepID=A0A9W7Y245_9FUNG|nr:hypothetical protein LPJ53_002469 [Coemansia erecta]